LVTESFAVTFTQNYEAYRFFGFCLNLSEINAVWQKQ